MKNFRKYLEIRVVPQVMRKKKRLQISQSIPKSLKHYIKIFLLLKTRKFNNLKNKNNKNNNKNKDRVQFLLRNRNIY